MGDASIQSLSCHDVAGIAHIKPGFLKPNVNSGQQASSNDNVTKEKPDKKERRGQNKKRQKFSNHRAEYSARLCPTIFRDIPCSYGEKCKFAHDTAAYMEKKPADIGELCVNFERLGKCPYSFSCRYASSHMSHENGVYRNKTKTPDNTITTAIETCEGNCLGKEVMIQLRRRKYDFKKANDAHKKAVAHVKAEVKIKTDLNNRPNSEKKRDISEPPEKKQRTDSNVKDHSDDTKVVPIEESRGRTGSPDRQGTTREAEHGDSADEPAVKRLRVDTDELKTDAVVPVSPDPSISNVDSNTDQGEIRLSSREKKTLVFDNKLYLAPLTTVGNLPFRRICKSYGADITCGEMAFASKILQGVRSEWALLRRHETEDVFGVQICGSFADQMTKCTQLINETCAVDFVDINVGCPIDLVFEMGAGSALMRRLNRFQEIVRGMVDVSETPVTVKIRTGVTEAKNTAHTLLPRLRDWGVSLTTLHGRSREQRYTKLADWSYINECSVAAAPMPLFGGGDILSFEDYNAAKTGVSGTMIARGALIKPWLFTEIKEQRHWDISSSERLDILRNFSNYGLEHWGSDTSGVETTRRFLLEWLSFLHRYIPVGLLERVPVKINERPPAYIGRDDLETLMASSYSEDWVKISEMLLGPVPPDFFFIPKHKASSFNDSS